MKRRTNVISGVALLAAAVVAAAVLMARAQSPQTAAEVVTAEPLVSQTPAEPVQTSGAVGMATDAVAILETTPGLPPCGYLFRTDENLTPTTPEATVTLVTQKGVIMQLSLTPQATVKVLSKLPTDSPYLVYGEVTQIPGVDPQGTPYPPVVVTFAVLMPTHDPLASPEATLLPPHTLLIAGQVVTVDPSYIIYTSMGREDNGCSPAPYHLRGEQFVLRKGYSLSLLEISSENGDYRIDVRPGDEGMFDDVLPYLRNRLEVPSS